MANNYEDQRLEAVEQERQDALNKASPRLAGIPFDSDRKLMTTVNEVDGRYMVIVKGAFDMLAARCVKGDLDTAKRITEEMSENALRVLAIACKTVDAVPENPTSEELESGLTFMGLVGMIDPPRIEVAPAVEEFKGAGVKTVMITGDHKDTAVAIAKELGILTDEKNAMTGADLEKLTDEEFEKIVENRGMQDLIQCVVMPTEDVVEVKNGQRKVRTRKMFPGYVIVKMIVTDESWYAVRNIRGCTGFVGPGSKPVPLTEAEVYRMGVEQRSVKVSYAVGDSVRIIDGPLEDCVGVVDELNTDENYVRVIVSMFGRETPVELELSQAERIED